MYLILQQDKAEDYVLATGQTTEIREFIRMAFENIGVEVEFRGKGIDEKALIKSSDGRFNLPVGKEVMSIDPKYFRPTEVDLLLGDPTKANTKLGWKPKYNVAGLCSEMIEADLELFRRDELLRREGFSVRKEFE
ncbi:MAG: GDP-mannose 4,6-dehydratase, partial [Flavobacteriales bacterium]|nr:GDP-mannose 4,6-dehydratase [Flavobacteriales bacterium]